MRPRNHVVMQDILRIRPAAFDNKRAEVREVAAVGLHRIVGKIAFHPEVDQVRVDRVV